MTSRKRSEVNRYGEAKFAVSDAVLINNSRFSYGKDTSTFHVAIILSIDCNHRTVPMYHIMYLDDTIDDVNEATLNKHNEADSVPSVSFNRYDFITYNGTLHHALLTYSCIQTYKVLPLAVIIAPSK